MKENNEQIEEMQKYLVNEIQNQNYDTDKFSEFMSKQKDNGTDLNSWTYEEIKQVVSAFKNQENSQNYNNEENIEKEVENVRNSFILSSEDQNKKLNNNNFNNFNNNNPYDKIFNDKEDNLKNIKNIMSDLTKEENNKTNKVSGFEDYEIIDSSEFIDSSTDKLECVKQKSNSLTDYDNLYVEIQK